MYFCFFPLGHILFDGKTGSELPLTLEELLVEVRKVELVNFGGKAFVLKPENGLVFSLATFSVMQQEGSLLSFSLVENFFASRLQKLLLRFTVNDVQNLVEVNLRWFETRLLRIRAGSLRTVVK